MQCKHCHVVFEGVKNINAHQRWCSANPNVDKHREAMRIANNSEKQRQQVKKAHLSGKYANAKYNKEGRPHTEETKRRLSDIARASPHRRLCKSVRDYVTKDGSIVKLDSSWEEVLAKRLDEIGVEWERPGPMKWIDGNGKLRNYFPDFYLPEHDLYLDPKNPYALVNQEEKVTYLKNNVSNLVFITTLEDCKNFRP